MVLSFTVFMVCWKGKRAFLNRSGCVFSPGNLCHMTLLRYGGPDCSFYHFRELSMNGLMYLLTAGHRLSGSSVLWLHPLHVLPGRKMSSIFKICFDMENCRCSGRLCFVCKSDFVVTQLPSGCVRVWGFIHWRCVCVFLEMIEVWFISLSFC